MQTVQTRYLGPTDTRGSRIKAFSEGFPRGVTVSYQHSSTSVEHARAVAAFVQARGWWGLWVGGGSADSRGQVYVCLARAHTPKQAEQVRELWETLTADEPPCVSLSGTGGPWPIHFCDAATSMLLILDPKET